MGSTATPFVTENLFVSRLRAAREQVEAPPFALLLNGVLLRVGHGRDPGVDGGAHHKSPLVDAAQASRLHLWRARQSTQGGVGGHGRTEEEHRRAPLCFVAHATHVSSTPLRRAQYRFAEFTPGGDVRQAMDSGANLARDGQGGACKICHL